jgi:GntR family transcriptional regulator/MocR family aminotransferase
MRAPEGVDAGVLAARLRDVGVLIEPGGAFFTIPDQTRRYYRLGYSSIAAERISDGIELIAAHLAA